MDEFQMCLPRVWGDVSISRLEEGENAPRGPPGNGDPEVPVLLFPYDYLTSNCCCSVSCHIFFARNRANALTLCIIYTSECTLNNTLVTDRGCTLFPIVP